MFFLRMKILTSFLFMLSAWEILSIQHCREPDTISMKKLRITVENSTSLEGIPNRFVNRKTIPTLNDKTCPSKSDLKNGRVLSTTPCPTYSEINIDENRIPQRVVQHRCKCLDCLPILNHVVKRAVSRCLPVYRYQMVLRRFRCDGGVYGYKAVMEPFVLGCSCQIDFNTNIFSWSNDRHDQASGGRHFMPE